MTRRAPPLALILVVLLTALLSPAAAAADPPLPASMAAVGDSITRAASSAGSLGVDAPQNSWATGTSTTVNSHASRLGTLGAQLTTYNLAVSGAKMVDLDGQMANVVGVQPDYVTVLMGGNDLCTDTVAQMTSVADFRAQFQAAMTRLMNGTQDTVVYVVSIPNVWQLWNLFKGNWWARLIWSSAGICQSLLANPTSTQAADVQRRDAVRQRNVAYNAELAAVCASYVRCRFDGNTAFDTSFTTSDVSGDYFHPSVAGQAKLASVSWAAGYTWTTGPAPNTPPTASFTSSCAYLVCSFTDASSDSDGTIAARQWAFGDGGTSTVATPPHTYGSGGTYSVTLTVTDDDGATATTTSPITVAAAPPPAGTMSVISLTGTSASTGKNAWAATATVTVVDQDNVPVVGAVVSASWSAGTGDTCTTGPAGQCQVVSDNLNSRKLASVTLTVTGVSHASYTYVDPPPIAAVLVPRP